MSCTSVDTGWSRHNQRIMSGKIGAAHLLAVLVHAPGVVDVVAFFGERFHQADVL